MSRLRPVSEPPALYAMVQPGLETVAADEITRDLGGEVKRTGQGLVVFRLSEVDEAVLRLRTTEDVFLLAWGSDKLSYRAEDLDRIRRWTAKEADWPQLLRIHHAVRPRPSGKPTYRLVTQMTGEHGYRRIDAGKALAQGLAGKLPSSWRPAEDNAAVEVWLTIQGASAVCGLRLSDRSMRHRTYKEEHRPASLRPTVAASMIRLAQTRPGHVVLDPMCGAGTILAEQLAVSPRPGKGPGIEVWGGDLDAAALRAAAGNLRRLGQPLLARWDATHLPLAGESVDRLVSNPPFGKQLSTPEEVGSLYRRMVPEYDRVLKSGAKAVLLVSDLPPLKEAARSAGWQLEQNLRVRVLGQLAALTVWRKRV
jgi:23S rRNA G2445 N2-methylase RlmL